MVTATLEGWGGGKGKNKHKQKMEKTLFSVGVNVASSMVRAETALFLTAHLQSW
jgi:hypothetical protein